MGRTNQIRLQCSPLSHGFRALSGDPAAEPLGRPRNRRRRRRLASKSWTAFSRHMVSRRTKCARSTTNSYHSIWATAPSRLDLSALQRKELTLRTLANRVFLAAKRAPCRCGRRHASDRPVDQRAVGVTSLYGSSAVPDLRAADPSARVVGWLGAGPLPRDQCGGRPPDKPADTSIHPVCARAGL